MKKILIVEDDMAISNMYKGVLEKDGYKVITAKDGEEGMDSALNSAPDLILLDIMLPKIDGFGVLQKLKAEPKTSSIPIIMLTNLGQDEDKEQGKKFGAADYWVKANFTPGQVSERIKQYLK
jgi:DNA-binding response OmpR family regulator